jgi:outer membrane protein TolC
MKGTTILVISLIALLPLSAQQSGEQTPSGTPRVRVLGVQEAVALALESNMGIQSQEITVAQDRLIRDSWWNRFYPDVSVRATLGRMNTEQTASGLAPVGSPDPVTGAFDFVAPFEEELPRWSLSTSLDLSLTLTPALSPGISLAGLELGASRIELEQQRAQVERDVQKSFYELLLTEARINLIRDRITTAEGRLEQTRLNYEAGLVDEFTLLSARVNVANLRPQLTQLSNGYQQAMMSFKMQIGVPLDEQIRLRGTVEPPAGVETIRKAVGSIEEGMLYGRYDIQGLQQRSLILDEQRRLNVYQSLPSVTFGFNVDPTFQGDPWGDNWLDGDLWEQRSGMFTIAVAQPIDPWFPRSETRNSIKGVERQLMQNQLSINRALTAAEIEVRSYISNIESSLESIEALELNVELAERAYDLAEQAYNNGLRDLTEVEQAEVDLQDARLQLIQEQQRVLASLLDLEYALNMKMEEFLR